MVPVKITGMKVPLCGVSISISGLNVNVYLVPSARNVTESGFLVKI